MEARHATVRDHVRNELADGSHPENGMNNPMIRRFIITLAAVSSAILCSPPPALAAPEELLVLAPRAGRARNSEADIVQLNDGRLCLIYTRFSDGGGDGSAADLALRTSSDNGKTWSDDRIIVPNEGRNVMLHPHLPRPVKLQEIRAGKAIY